MFAAAENEMPIPVAAAIYAAMQSGHFGKTARTMPGTRYFKAELSRGPASFDPATQQLLLLVNDSMILPLRFQLGASKVRAPAGSTDYSSFFRNAASPASDISTHFLSGAASAS